MHVHPVSGDPELAQLAIPGAIHALRSRTRSARAADRPLASNAPRVGIAALLLSALASGTAAADVIFVTASQVLPLAFQNGNTWATAYKSLQDALDEAVSGDQIWVAVGTYKPTTSSDRFISFEMEDGVEVLGGFQVGDAFEFERDPAANLTTLDGDIGTPILKSDNSYHVVAANNANASALLDGFTIRNGNSDDGIPGGGMRMTNSTTMTVRNCRFTQNSTNSTGGGCDALGGSPKFIDCVFDNNTATEGAGLNLISSSNVVVANCHFAGNDAGTNGGGIKGQNTNTLRILNSVFSANTADTKGGGVALVGGTNATIGHCTFRGNESPLGAAVRSESITLALSNSILFDDVGGEHSHSGTGATTIKGCCIEGIALDVNGNFSADPQFVDFNGANNILGDFDDNLRLLPNSLCIDRGDSAAIPTDAADLDGDGSTVEPLPVDKDGNDRLFNAVNYNEGLGFTPYVDVGAFERSHSINIFCVDHSATGANNGADWGDAFLTIQDAIVAASDVKLPGAKEIWVADGTYKPTTTTDRTKTFAPPAGVGVYGGFAGGEATKKDRDAFASPTILSGEIGAPGLADNSFHVVDIFGAGHNANTILDGFTIMHGNANGGTVPVGGGGVRVHSNGKATIRGCRFLGNSAVSGGGAFVSGANQPLFVNCQFSGNHATGGGGAAQCNSTANFLGCTIVGNTASGSCGGVIALSQTVIVNNSIVYFNVDGFNTGEKEQVNTASGGGLAVNNCCITCAGEFFANVTSIGANPLLADADGPDGVFGTLDDSPVLLAGSPCIDWGLGNASGSGTDSGDADEDGSATDPTGCDIANQPRVKDDAGMPNTPGGAPPNFPDIGAWEFQATTTGPLPSPADLDQDGDVDGADLGLLLAAFGSPGPVGDLNASCFVDGADLGLLLSEWSD